MKTPWEALSAAITRLNDRVDGLPAVREATITSISPLQVQFDTDSSPVTARGGSTFLSVGSRVLTIKLRHYVWVVSSGTVKTDGYRLLTTLHYPANGTFTKGSYPDARAVRVKVQAGGGAGGGAPAASAGNHTDGGGGGGGGYAEAFLLVGALSASMAVTVGAGGVAASGAAGGNGGSSSFGSLCVASGGTGGEVGVVTALSVGVGGGPGGAGTTGDLLLTGAYGDRSTGNATLGRGGKGGDSTLGGGAQGGYTGAGGGGAAGVSGGNYGAGGGGGTCNASGTARAGGNGAPGIIIVEVYV
jgi:hypothetical protein